MPKEYELRKENYMNRKLYKKSYEDIVYSSLTVYGSKLTKGCEAYKSKIGNFRYPMVILISRYAYGLNNLQQFQNTEEIVIFQAIRNANQTIYGTAKWYTEDSIRTKQSSYIPLIETVYNNLHTIAVEVAKKVTDHNGKIKKIEHEKKSDKFQYRDNIASRKKFYDLSDCWDLE
jgi:hypothetical protein